MTVLVPAYANQQLRVVPEVTYGTTPSSGWKKLNSVRLDLEPVFETEAFASSGDAVPSINVLNDDFTQGDMEGKADYNGVVYPLSSLFGAATITTPSGGTNARQWVYEWDGRTPFTPQSYTFDVGVPTQAERVTGCLFNGFSISGSREGMDFSTSMWGQKLQNVTAIGGYAAGSPPTDSVTDIEPVPMFPLHFSLFMDDAWADLGDTRLLHAYEMDLGFGEKFERTRPINALLTSDGYVEMTDQEHTLTINFAVDATERGLLDDIRAGQMKFIRIEALGNTIEGSIKNRFAMDLACFITEAGPASEYNSIYTREFTFRLGRDAVSGNCAAVTVVNELTAL